MRERHSVEERPIGERAAYWWKSGLLVTQTTLPIPRMTGVRTSTKEHRQGKDSIWSICANGFRIRRPGGRYAV